MRKVIVAVLVFLLALCVHAVFCLALAFPGEVALELRGCERRRRARDLVLAGILVDAPLRAFVQGRRFFSTVKHFCVAKSNTMLILTFVQG